MNTPVPFSPHKNFSENLLALCTRHGSIASVCRLLDMNRQQFNKYLSGSSLPSPATLERICKFFRVDPEIMFQHPNGFRGRRVTSLYAETSEPGDVPSETIGEVVNVIKSMGKSDFREGCYFLYYPWPRNPQMCARSAMIVHRSKGLTLFSRLTKFRVLGSSQKYYLHGRHDGIVLESEGTRFFLATNKKGFGEVSLLTFGIAANISRDFITGLALVMGASANPLALRVLLEYRGSLKSVRDVIRQAGIVALGDASVPQVAREAVMEAPSREFAHLTPFRPLDQLSTSHSLISEYF
jgi:transcriptional regulator with XRE-family HTH domain